MAKINPQRYKKRYTKRQKEMYQLRRTGHQQMANLGRDSGTPRRNRYYWLAWVTGLGVHQCHFTTMSKEQMEQAIREIKKARERIRRGGQAEYDKVRVEIMQVQIEGMVSNEVAVEKEESGTGLS